MENQTELIQKLTSFFSLSNLVQFHALYILKLCSGCVLLYIIDIPTYNTHIIIIHTCVCNIRKVKKPEPELN